MACKTIEELVNSRNQTIDSEELYHFLHQKLDELYKKDQAEPLLDYAEIRYAAMIDVIYELMPSLRNDLTPEQSIMS